MSEALKRELARRKLRMSGRMRAKLDHAKGRDWLSKRLKKQDGVCAYCGVALVLEMPTKFNSRKVRVATLDHVIPISRGGAHHWENTAAACKPCNQAKGAQTEDEFRAAIAKAEGASPGEQNGGCDD